MNYSLFTGPSRIAIEEGIKNTLNKHCDFLTDATASSTRAAGDGIEHIISKHFQSILGDWCVDYSDSFARRAMADLAFRTKDENYCLMDVKTHRTSASFSMPQLTSVERLTRLYEGDENVFCLIMVKYDVRDLRITVSDVLFVPIEFLDWRCLTIGALGWGQIQISNSNNIFLAKNPSRKEWMVRLCDQVLAFYPKEIGKIQSRITRFEEIRRYWLAKPG